MKKILFAMGLLSTSLFSTAQAHNRYFKFACIEQLATPDAAKTLEFYETGSGEGFVTYSYNNIIGRKVPIESMQCHVTDIVKTWKCVGEKYTVELIYDWERNLGEAAYVYSTKNGEKLGNFYCH